MFLLSPIPAFATAIALACAAASARRLWFAVNATVLHPAVLDDALAKASRGATASGGGESSSAAALLERLRALVAAQPEAEWERDLLEALAAPASSRAALVNEQLTELDHRLQRWSRVPRVCASIATSAGFMLATLLLRTGLVDSGDMPIELGELVVRGLVGDALTVGAMGMVGTAFCIAAHGEAKRIVKERSRAADRLVERLEGLRAAAEGGPYRGEAGAT